MASSRTIVIIGGGPAGVGAALAARTQDPSARVMLLTDEPYEPYEKPPLSKTVLTGKAMPHDALIAGPKGLAGASVEIKLATRCEAIDRAAREVVTQTGERIPYDALVLATGSINRVLPMFPPGRGIYYLRSAADALAMREHLHRSKALIVIGGGLIGLEVAASAAELGVKATVIEIAPRILARVCDEETSVFIHDYHRARGVDIRTGAAVADLRRLPDGTLAVDLFSGETFAADLMVVGAGVMPDDRLAQAAGITTRDGILVDNHCRTSVVTIYAAGDCTCIPGTNGHVRLENWRHAQEHGAVAGRNAAGGDVVYHAAPSFWSEQYDLYMQGVGWLPTRPTHKVHRRIGGNAMLLFDIEDGRLVYAMGINAQRDIATARRLIERAVPVDADELADPTKPLAAMLKAKT